MKLESSRANKRDATPNCGSGGGRKPNVTALREMAKSARRPFTSKYMLTSSEPLQGTGTHDDVDESRKPFCPPRTAGTNPFRPTFNTHAAFVPSSNPPKTEIHGARPYTQNFSEEFVDKCDGRNLQIQTESKEEELEGCKLSSFNAAIRHDIVRDAFKDQREFAQEMSENWSVRRERKRQQRLQHERNLAQNSLSFKNTMKSQMLDAYTKEQEKRRENVVQALAQKKREKMAKLDSQHEALREELESFVYEKIDPDLSRRESLRKQRQLELHTNYQLEVTRKMHAQIMPKITEMDSDVIAARRRSQYDKYLQISNRKKVYLDEVDTSEYDPFGFPGAPVLKFKGGAPSNCALKGNDADARLGEDPAKRERNKWVREKELAISLAQGGADPNVVTAVVEGELRKHFNFKRQAKQSTGDGNPHMQISGRNADLQFRETLNHFWWTKTNFKDSQYYDRPLKSTGGNPSQAASIDLNHYQLPQGKAVGSEQHRTLNSEFQAQYGKGKRCMPEPGHGQNLSSTEC